MASKNFYVDINLQEQQLIDANLSGKIGIPSVANDAALTTLAGQLTGNTNKIFVFHELKKTFYVWNGTSFDSVGGAVGAFVARGGLDAAAGISIATTTITDGTNTYNNISNGNIFLITDPGTITFLGSQIVETGDWLVFAGTPVGDFANNSELTDVNNWTIIQNNVSAATTTTLGLVREATQTEVNEGNTTGASPAAVTPERLKATLAARKVSFTSEALANNAPTPFVHNFTTNGYITDVNQVNVEVVLSSTKEVVEVKVIKQTNQVTLESNKTITVDISLSAI